MGVDVMTWKPRFDYTDEPFEPADGYPGGIPIESYKMRLRRYNRIELARRNPMLLKQRPSDGAFLYKLSGSGHLCRAFEVSDSTKRAVHTRDRVCVWCGSDERLEVDHIVRYADGGSNTRENLRLLCHTCHSSRGGRA